MDVAFRVTVARKLQSGSVPKFLLPWFPLRVMMRMGTERKRMMILPLIRRKMQRRTWIRTIHLRMELMLATVDNPSNAVEWAIAEMINHCYHLVHLLRGVAF